MLRALYIATLSCMDERGVEPLPMRERTKPVLMRGASERQPRLPGGEQMARLLTVEDTRPAQFSEQQPGTGSTEGAGGRA